MVLNIVITIVNYNRHMFKIQATGLLQKFVAYDRKKFYNIDTCGLYYKAITIVIWQSSQMTPVP